MVAQFSLQNLSGAPLITLLRVVEKKILGVKLCETLRNSKVLQNMAFNGAASACCHEKGHSQVNWYEVGCLLR
jgi:hypothetical protein